MSMLIKLIMSMTKTYLKVEDYCDEHVYKGDDADVWTYLNLGVWVGHHGDEHVDESDDADDVEHDIDKMTNRRSEVVTVVHFSCHVAFLHEKRTCKSCHFEMECTQVHAYARMLAHLF